MLRWRSCRPNVNTTNHAAVATQGYDEAYDSAVAAGGANCELALWILDVHGQSDFYDQSYKTAQKYFTQLLSTATDNEQNKENPIACHCLAGSLPASPDFYDRAIAEYLRAQKLAEDLDKGQKESPQLLCQPKAGSMLRRLRPVQ